MNKQKRDWPKILKDHLASGESVKEFCESRGINTTVFYKNRKLACGQPLVEIPVVGSLEFGPIVVMHGEFSVSIPYGFDRECLKSVLEVIGELK